MISPSSTILRTGSILIVVTGISAILIMMAVAFLVRMRSDQEESNIYLREIQARVMLTSAMQYIQEGARLGWSDPNVTTSHTEGHGWIDVRDGLAGPRDHRGRVINNPAGAPIFTDLTTGYGTAFPAVAQPGQPYRPARCEMYVRERPPWALQMKLRHNPIANEAFLPGAPASNPAWSTLVNYQNPNPQAAGNPATYAAWGQGDATPRVNSLGMAWFRVYRKKISTFIITCGAGATKGFRSWAEMTASEQAIFDTQELFEELQRKEARLWYEVEWSSAVGYGMMNRGFYRGAEVWELNNLGHPFSASQDPVTGAYLWGAEKQDSRNLAGSFTYVQRLIPEPSAW